jgi:hypothetical protein
MNQQYHLAFLYLTLWIESEFDKQNKAKQAYFQIFKGITKR